MGDVGWGIDWGSDENIFYLLSANEISYCW